jgi:hypothetical protein
LRIIGRQRPGFADSQNGNRQKNKFGKSGIFSTPKKSPSTYQLSPEIHHKFTTKEPRSTTRFCQKPLQKRTNPSSKK